MNIDLSSSKIRVVINPRAISTPRTTTPHDIEGTVLGIETGSRNTIRALEEGRALEVIADERGNFNADIHVRWDNDLKVILWAGAFNLRNTGNMPACASIWDGKTIYIDDRPYHTLIPRTQRPLRRLGGMSAPGLKVTPQKTVTMVLYPNTEMVPPGHNHAVVCEGGIYYRVNKYRGYRREEATVRTTPLEETIPTGVQVQLQPYDMPVEVEEAPRPTRRRSTAAQAFRTAYGTTTARLSSRPKKKKIKRAKKKSMAEMLNVNFDPNLVNKLEEATASLRGFQLEYEGKVVHSYGNVKDTISVSNDMGEMATGVYDPNATASAPPIGLFGDADEEEVPDF